MTPHGIYEIKGLNRFVDLDSIQEISQGWEDCNIIGFHITLRLQTEKLYVTFDAEKAYEYFSKEEVDRLLTEYKEARPEKSSWNTSHLVSFCVRQPLRERIEDIRNDLLAAWKQWKIEINDTLFHQHPPDLEAIGRGFPPFSIEKKS